MRTIHNLMEIEESHWIRRYDEVLKSGKLSTKTVKGYRYDLKNFFNWIIETYKREMDIKEISELVLVEYRFQLRFFNRRRSRGIPVELYPGQVGSRVAEIGCNALYEERKRRFLI